jgi:hypothetical protein
MVEPLTRHCLRIPTKGTPAVWHREKVGLRATVGDAKLKMKKKDGSRVVDWTPTLPGPSERINATLPLPVRCF